MRIALFSATIPYDVINLTKKIMTNPISITLRPEQLTLDCIQQYYIALQNDSHKYETIKDLFSLIEVKQSIIYVNTIKRVNDLYDAMTNEGYPVCCIHSSMEKSQREDSLKQFRNGEFRILISSGITARGIDIQQVSVVINFDITKDVNTYLHAIGRSGRYGRKGLAINFVTRSDIDIMKRIEKHYKIEIKELPGNFNELI
jgi:superfamily II DNA/RNA helicase